MYSCIILYSISTFDDILWIYHPKIILRVASQLVYCAFLCGSWNGHQEQVAGSNHPIIQARDPKQCGGAKGFCRGHGDGDDDDDDDDDDGDGDGDGDGDDDKDEDENEDEDEEDDEDGDGDDMMRWMLRTRKMMM